MHGQYQCKSCGRSFPWQINQYCSKECKEELLYQLRAAEELLNTLNTEYVLLRWTYYDLILKIIPYNQSTAFCFSCKRYPGITPARELSQMVRQLKAGWLRAYQMTSSRFQASQILLKQAHNKESKTASFGLKASQRMPPTSVVKQLSDMKLTVDDLLTAGWQDRLKKAYREQVKIKHPDMGGTNKEFADIKDAFDSLTAWAANPIFDNNIATLPDYWVYDKNKSTDRWSPPA
jgi:hypothetical protein